MYWPSGLSTGLNRVAYVLSAIVLASSAVAQPPFPIGSEVQVSSPPLRVRAAPGTQGAVLGAQEGAATGTVISDPYYADGYWWFEVDYSSGPDGWSAAGSADEAFLVLRQ